MFMFRQSGPGLGVRLRACLIGYVVAFLGGLIGLYVTMDLVLGTPAGHPFRLFLGPVLIVLPCVLARYLGEISLAGAVFVMMVNYIAIPMLFHLLSANASPDIILTIPPILLLEFIIHEPVNSFLATGMLLVALAYMAMDWKRHGYAFSTMVGPVALSALMLLRLLTYESASSLDLFMALIDGDLKEEEARRILDRGVDVNASTFFTYEFPLMFLVVTSDTSPKVVDLLIEAGAEVNPRSLVGSPLEMAVILGREQIMHSLLAAGANVHARNEFGHSPLKEAARMRRVDMVRAMLSHEDAVHDNTLLHEVAAKNELRSAKTLLAAGMRVNVADRWGAAPLHLAARHGHAEMVSLLLGGGADIHALDRRGHTAFNIAVALGHTDIAGRLLGEEGDPDTTYARFIDALQGGESHAMSERERAFYVTLGRETMYYAILDNRRPVTLPIPDPSVAQANAYLQVLPLDQGADIEHIMKTVTVFSYRQGDAKVPVSKASINHPSSREWQLIFNIKDDNDAHVQFAKLTIESEANHGMVGMLWHGLDRLPGEDHGE